MKIQPNQLKQVLDEIGKSMITLDHGPMMDSCEINPIKNDPTNVVLGFSWTDDEGYEYGEDFTEESFLNAEIEANLIKLKNSEGEDSEIRLYAIVSHDLQSALLNTI